MVMEVQGFHRGPEKVRNSRALNRKIMRECDLYRDIYNFIYMLSDKIQ